MTAVTIDWCEHNNIHSEWIVEYYNTISSVMYIVMGCKGYVLYPNNRRIFEAMIIVGITSMMFHGIMMLEFQLCDEISIIYMLMNLILNIYNTSIIEKNVIYLGVLGYIIAICATGYESDAAKNIEFELFQKTLGAVGTILFCHVIFTKQVTKHFKMGTLYFVLGYMCWWLDYAGCLYLKSINIHIEFHACWHILSAIGVYYFAVYSVNVTNDCCMNVSVC